MMRGEIVWLFAYDVAFETNMDGLRAALKGAPSYRKAGRYRKAPESVSVYSPLVLDVAERELPEGRLPAGVPGLGPVASRVKVFAVGAISVEIRMPFDVAGARDLLPFRHLEEDPESPVRKYAAATARDVIARARPHLVRPAKDLGRSESYAVICATEADGLEEGTRAWLASRRAEVAALLLGESSAEDLSADQVDETLRLSYSYSRSDLVVVDWDAMFLVDTQTGYDELLYVAEVANLQMVELRTHDEALERAVDGAYDDIERYRRSPHLFKAPAKLTHSLRQEMMDLAHMSDEILNLSKYFGDWYLARIYTGLASRFHLAEWEAQLERKLKTVSTMYELIARHTTDRRMIVLELLIVLLFVVDVVLVILMGV